MNLMPTKRLTDQYLGKTKHHSFSFRVNDIAHLLYEIAKLIIVICLFILVIRSPKVILFSLIPALSFVIPAFLIRLFSKLLSHVFRLFIR